MANGYEMAVGGINNLVQFLAGVQRGREKRRQYEKQESIRKLITNIGQQGQMDVTMKLSPEGEVSYSLKPRKQPKPTEYGSVEQRNLRLTYGLEQPTSQELIPYTPQGIPYAGGGYIGVPPGRELTPDESLTGAVPLPEYAPYYFEELYAQPMRERYERAGYRPKIAGYERIKEQAIIGSPEEVRSHSVTQKKKDKAMLFKQYIQSLSPNLNIQTFVTKYGGKEAPAVILRKLRKTPDDFFAWVESTYGKEMAQALFPERYIDYTKMPGTP